jgi:HlyD family secretion protein
MGMKKQFVKACAIVLSAAVLAAACAKKDNPSTGTSAGPAAAAKKSVDAFGTVKAKTTRNINLDFPAVLEKKLVTEGQRVKRGDRLFLFSRSAYDSQIKSKTYELSMAQYDLRKSTLDVSRLKDELEAAEQDVARARKELENKQKVLAMGAASQSEVDDYGKRLAAEEQKKRSIQRSLEGYTSGQVNGLELQKSRISILETELQELQDKSKKSYLSGNAVVSDADDGIVYEIGYTEGDYITTARKLCSLMDLGSLIVEANIPEEFAKDVKIGSKADIVPIADNSKAYTGTVVRVSSLAVKASGETVIPVEIAIEGKDGFLLPNFNVDVKIY